MPGKPPGSDFFNLDVDFSFYMFYILEYMAKG